MNERDRENLVEEAAGAWRPRGPAGGVRPHPAWHDLDAEGRAAVADVRAVLATLEAASDPERLSGTARAVLARIRRGSDVT